MPKSDQTPLLPSHVNQTHRLSSPAIKFPSASSSAIASEQERVYQSPDRSIKQERQGVPKLTRECLWSEIKCYGSYILPTFLVFGVLVIGASLAAVGWKKGWFSHK